MVGALDDVEVMFDDQHGVAGVAEFEQHFQQLRHVGKMQSAGRLVEYVKCAASGFLGKFSR